MILSTSEVPLTKRLPRLRLAMTERVQKQCFVVALKRLAMTERVQKQCFVVASMNEKVNKKTPPEPVRFVAYGQRILASIASYDRSKDPKKRTYLQRYKVARLFMDKNCY